MLSTRWTVFALGSVARCADGAAATTDPGAASSSGSVAAAQGQVAGAGNAGSGNGRMYTQAELDAQVNEAVTNRLARERRINDEKYGNVDQDRAELDRLRREDTDRKRKVEEDKGNYDRALQSLRDEYGTKEQTWQTRERELLAEIEHDRCFNALQNELASAGAIDAEDLAHVLRGRVKLDESRRVIVTGPDGKQMFASGNAVTIKDLVTKYKADKPWAFKADNPGQGSNSPGGASTQDDGEASQLQRELQAAQQKHEKAREKAARSGAVSDLNASRQAAKKVAEIEAKLKKLGAHAAA